MHECSTTPGEQLYLSKIQCKHHRPSQKYNQHRCKLREREHILRIILHEYHLSEHHSPTSGLVSEKDVSHGGYGRSIIAHRATKIDTPNGVFDKITGIIKHVPIGSTIQHPRRPILTTSGHALLSGHPIDDWLWSGRCSADRI